MSIPIMRFGGNDDDNDARGVRVNNDGYVYTTGLLKDSRTIEVKTISFNTGLSEIAAGATGSHIIKTASGSGNIGRIIDIGASVANPAGSGSGSHSFYLSYSALTGVPMPLASEQLRILYQVQADHDKDLRFSLVGGHLAADNNVGSYNDYDQMLQKLQNNVYFGDEDATGLHVTYYNNTNIAQPNTITIYIRSEILAGSYI